MMNEKILQVELTFVSISLNEKDENGNSPRNFTEDIFKERKTHSHFYALRSLLSL